MTTSGKLEAASIAAFASALVRAMTSLLRAIASLLRPKLSMMTTLSAGPLALTSMLLPQFLMRPTKSKSRPPRSGLFGAESGNCPRLR